MRHVSRNHAVGSIVENYLSVHPEKVREEKERARLDEEDKLGNAPLSLRKRARGDGADLSAMGGRGADSDDDDDDDDEGSYSDSDGYSDDDGYGAGGQMAAMMRAAAENLRVAMARHHSSCPSCTRLTAPHLLHPLTAAQRDELPGRLGRGGRGGTLPLLNSHERTVLTAIIALKVSSACTRSPRVSAPSTFRRRALFAGRERRRDAGAVPERRGRRRVHAARAAGRRRRRHAARPFDAGLPAMPRRGAWLSGVPVRRRSGLCLSARWASPLGKLGKAGLMA